MSEKSTKARHSSATDLAPRPGDFPIGSVSSRAAARRMLMERFQDRQRIEFVTNMRLPHQDNTKPHATPWSETTDGGLMRMLYVPLGMTADEARRIVDSTE